MSRTLCVVTIFIISCMMTCIYAGESGLSYAGVNVQLPGDIQPVEITGNCSSALDGANFRMTCPNGDGFFGVTGTINNFGGRPGQVKVLQAVYSNPSNSTCVPRYIFGGPANCWCNARLTLQSRCNLIGDCSVTVGTSSACTPTGCLTGSRRLVATFNCVGQTRSIVWSVSQATPSSRIFWTTSRGVYVVPAGAATPSTNPTLLVNFTANIGVQTIYHAGAYEFNNRLYIWHGANRHFELPNIPTSPINLLNTGTPSGGHRTAVASDGGRLAAIVHIPYGSDPFGRIWAAGVTTSLRTWSRSSTTNTWGVEGTWPIPLCGSVRCFEFSRNAALVLPQPILVNNVNIRYIVFGGTNGRLIFADTSDLQFVKAPEINFGGAGSVMVMRYADFGGKQTLFYGTSLGLVFQFDLNARRLVSLVFVTSSASASLGILDLIWDQSNQALIASAGDGALVAGLARILVSDGAMEILDFEDFPELAGNLTTGAGRAMLYRPDLNRIFVGADQPVATNAIRYPWNLPSSIYSFRIASCENYECEACGVTDPSYCGYCPGSGTCELVSQLNSTSCPAGQGTFSKPAVCPFASSLSIISGASSGGSSVAIRGQNFFAGTGAQSLYRCDFGGSSGTVTAVTSTSVTCQSPSGVAGTSVEVALFFRNRLIKGEILEFTYVDCASQTCSTCFGVGSGDCNWCYRAGACAPAGSCSGPFSSTACPALVSVSNPISVSGSNSQFSLTVTDLPSPGETYRVSINSLTAPCTATGNTLSCLRPSGIGAITTVPIVEIDNSVFWRRFTQPRTNDPTIEVYDCATIGACFTCLNRHPDCGFCSGTCSYDQVSAGCSNSTSICPIITATNPTRLHYVADAGTTLTLTIADPVQTANAANFRCVWLDGTGSPIATTTALGASTLTTVLCPVPSVNLTRTLSVEVRVLTSPHSNAFPVTVYDCSAGSTCNSCTDTVLRPKCLWCNSLLTCEALQALPGGQCPQTTGGAGAGCPTIAITPDQDTTGGGATITVFPNPYPAVATNAMCAFRGSFINADSPAIANGTSFSCTAPAAALAGNVLVTLTISDVDYATPVPFTYYDCAFVSTGVLRNCSNCLARTGCSWCGATCGSTASCAVPLSVCPVITSVSPNFTDADNADFISVVVSPNPPNGYTYECVFGTARTTAIEEPDGFRCPTPVGASAGLIPVRIGVQGVSSGFFSTDAVPPLVDFFRCNPLSRQCGPSCFSASPYCGYCMETGQCSGRTACSRALSVRPELLLDKTWFNATSGCPSVASYGPTYMQVTIPGRRIISEEFFFQLANLELPAVNNTPNGKKRQVSISDLGCSFGADQSPVDRYDPANNTFYCTAPPLSDQGFYSLSVTFRGNRINSESPVRLQAQDCYSIPVCGLCVLQPNCGWCRGSVRCMTKAWCDAEPIAEFGPECPALVRVTPSSSVTTGDVDVTISGGPFVNSPELAVFMEYTLTNVSVELNTTWKSSSELLVRIPPSVGDREGEVRLKLFINDTLYTPSELSFFYVSLSSLQGVSPGAIGGISAAAIIVILILIAALIIMKTRRVGFWAQFKLTEPNYEQVAFGTMLLPQWKVPKDNWEILAIKLLSKNTGFVLGIMQTTPATDQDKIARSLCHVYEWHHKSVDYGILFVTEEVKRNLEENTIFRNNSMASKWFKFYSKIVGIKYLFDHLARFIFELNKISDLRNKEQAEASGGNSLLTLDMEVDPSKFGNDAFTDSEANVYQLILACQKVFTAFNKSVSAIPAEFKRVFQSMRESIVNKFKSDDAVLKAVGGFFFLRFCCPAITAPHAYGLLENPPNENAQRQLVLIGKVIQNLANMTMPGAKEDFMRQLNDFFVRNIPKMRHFYTDLLSSPDSGEDTIVVATPDVVRVNGLGFILEHLIVHQNKLKEQFEMDATSDNELAQLNADLFEILGVYPSKPKKAATDK